MKMKILTVVFLLSCLALCPITSSADYPTGTLGYSDEIAVGSEFKWTVSILEQTGVFRTGGDIHIGEFGLQQGTIIKLVVTHDPDDQTYGASWFDVFIDGEEVTDPEDMYIGWGIYYAYGAGFINPVTYTNTTGTYNIYEQVFKELESESTDFTETYTSVNYIGATYIGSYTGELEYNLLGEIFSVKMYIHNSMTVSGLSDVSESLTLQMETTLNTRTGLLGKSEMQMEIVSEYYNGEMHVLIDSGYAKTPFNWMFSFLSITVVTAVLALAKRKRK